jgi:hypothetical protein
MFCSLETLFKGGNILSRSLIRAIQSEQRTGQIERQRKDFLKAKEKAKQNK